MLVLRMMDQWYTRDENGNGWYVPHRYRPDVPYDRIACVTNVISLFLADRRTMEAKIAEGMRRAAEAAELPYDRALRQLVRSDMAYGQVPNPTDGPFAREVDYHGGGFTLCLLNLVRHDVARVSLALAAYRHEHGRYPADLSDLVPAYLAAVPMNPFTGKAIGYRLEEEYGYVIPGSLRNWDEPFGHLSGLRDEPWAELRRVDEDEPVKQHAW